MNTPKIGETYSLYHRRFGRAVVRVTGMDETWADCEIISGTLRGMGRFAIWEPGDTKPIRIEHGTWTPHNLTSAQETKTSTSSHKEGVR